MSEYPSVTQILSPLINTKWYTKEGANRGSKIHAECARLLVHRETTEDSPYLNSFIDWLDFTNPIALFTEQKLVNHHIKLQGTPDFIGTIWGRDDIGIIDWKTARATSKWWALQLAAYKYLAENAYGITIRWIGALRIRHNGKNALFTDYTNIYDESIKSFFALKEEYEEKDYYAKYYEPNLSAVN